MYLAADAIARRVRELADEVARDYAGQTPLLVAPLRASTVFVADFSRALAVPHELDFVQLESYRTDSHGSRAVRLVKDLERPVAGRDVLVVETLLDTGLTVNALVRALESRGPRSLAIVALLDRPHRRLVASLPLRYVGFEVPDELLAGYGLGLERGWQALPDLRFVTA